MKFYLISVLAAFVSAGSVCLPKGLSLAWTYPSSDTIQFTLSLPSSITEKYQWVGIGFKDLPDDEGGMVGADINNIIIGSDPVDCYAAQNGRPSADTEFSGVDNIENPSYDESNFVYTWSRPVDSGDRYDKVYTSDKRMKLLWAVGKVSNGVQMKHGRGDRGTMEVELSDESNSECNNLMALN